MGPKTIALFWAAAKITSIDQLADAIDSGRLAELPRMGQKQLEKIRKGIDDYRRSAGRFRIDQAAEAAKRIELYLLAFPGFEKVTPAGSLRRGRETAGDLDLLVTGPACAPDKDLAARSNTSPHFPAFSDLIAKGENKVSFHLCGRHAGGRSPAAFRILWRGPAVLYRLQGAQRHAAAAGAQDGLHAERVVPGAAGRRLHRSPPPPRKRSTPRCTWTGFRRKCAKTWARSMPPPATPCPA